MNYSLHKLNIACDKKFTVKNSEDEKVQISGLSKKRFNEEQREASKLARTSRDYSQAFFVIGNTFFKEAKNEDSDDDILEIKGKKYIIGSGNAAFTKGYLYVGNNEFVRVKSRAPLIILFLLLGLLILGVCLGLYFCPKFCPNRPDTPTETVDFSIDGTDTGETTPNQLPSVSENEEFIEITVFPEVVVSEATPTIPLYNSENNTVYFQYQIYEGENLLHKTGLIPPGYRVQWNAKELLSVGKHDLKFVIACYDVGTKAPCDGATTYCTVTVE